MRGRSLDEDAARFLTPGELMLCYACRATGTCQLGLHQVAPAGERAIVAQVACPPNFEGGPQVAHGGWTAAVFDEVLGHLGPLHGALTVTGALSVHYLRPVPIGRDLEVRAWVDRVEGRRWMLRAAMTLAGSTTLLGRAEGVFVERRPDHFERSRRWLEGQA